MPLRYRTLLALKRCIFLCTVSWILAIRYFFLFDGHILQFSYAAIATEAVVKILPVIFAIIAATVIAYIVHRAAGRIPGNESLQRVRSFGSSFKASFKVFRIPIFILLVFTPAIFASYVILDVSRDETDLLCDKIGSGFVLASLVLSNFYLCGMPVFIVVTHPVYWNHVKNFFERSQ